ncbi:52/55 kDa [Guinea pig adenovirus]|nr:52/55 kDa [Guinea pig adenovirus]
MQHPAVNYGARVRDYASSSTTRRRGGAGSVADATSSASPAYAGATADIAAAAAVDAAVATSDVEGEGLARLYCDPETHPRCVMKRDGCVAAVPQKNVLRDACDPPGGSEAEDLRHARYAAGRDIALDPESVIRDDDFVPCDRSGISRARAQLQAADLKTAFEQTVRQESNFQRSFNATVRGIVSRDDVLVGLMHLWDFVEAYVGNPTSKALNAQLFLIAQHSRDEGLFREALLNICDRESKWLLDLINVLQTIVVQERHLSAAEKVAAVNYSVITLAKHYARRIYQSPYVPLDKELKIATFYMRMVLKILTLADDLGVYRNERMQRVVGLSRRRELSDAQLLCELRRCFSCTEPAPAGVVGTASVQAMNPASRAVFDLREDDDDEDDMEDESAA